MSWEQTEAICVCLINAVVIDKWKTLRCTWINNDRLGTSQPLEWLQAIKEDKYIEQRGKSEWYFTEDACLIEKQSVSSCSSLNNCYPTTAVSLFCFCCWYVCKRVGEYVSNFEYLCLLNEGSWALNTDIVREGLGVLHNFHYRESGISFRHIDFLHGFLTWDLHLQEKW